MMIGDPSTFAIESTIEIAWESLRWRGIGQFLIHVGGREYGLRRSHAASLGCHLINVCFRIAQRGTHVAPFAAELDAEQIAWAFFHSTYADDGHDIYLGLPTREFFQLSRSGDFWGLTNGQEAFDDGSEILQFDLGDTVRIIAYTKGEGWTHDPATLRDVRIDADVFYDTLQRWTDAFETEWTVASKSVSLA